MVRIILEKDEEATDMQNNSRLSQQEKLEFGRHCEDLCNILGNKHPNNRSNVHNNPTIIENIFTDTLMKSLTLSERIYALPKTFEGRVIKKLYVYSTYG